MQTIQYVIVDLNLFLFGYICAFLKSFWITGNILRCQAGCKWTSISSSNKTNLFDSNLAVGNIVMHERFGKGEVINLEGVGADKKAEIRFEVGGIKKLLLRFAKLDVIG